MLLKACPTCKGDGFYRVPKGHVHPLTNIYGARPIRSEVSGGCSLADYARSIIGYEFDCYSCGGLGEIRWTRGRSLVPRV
jgi:hypothetical protein